MREAGYVVAQTKAALVRAIAPGMKTRELDVIASRQIFKMGAQPSFKGYRGFPATICISVNEQIVHGIPGNRVIRDGDIVSMDVGAIVEGYQGDSAVTVGVGTISLEAQRLIDATREALDAGILQALREKGLKHTGTVAGRAAAGAGNGSPSNEASCSPRVGARCR